MNSSHLISRRFGKTALLVGLWWGGAYASPSTDWNLGKASAKRDYDAPDENNIERRRITIRGMKIKNEPSIYRDVFELNEARNLLKERATAELIGQLEELVRRPGQNPRIGELKMRLSELYFERAQESYVHESADWEKSIDAWDKLSDAEKNKNRRPILKTPKTDEFRRKAVNLYSDLEKQSRGADKGRSKLIRRDEVLFFLGSTLMQLGRAKEAVPHFEEMVKNYSTSPRIFSARLQLADYYFETGKFQQSIPHYLLLASGKSGALGDDPAQLQAYALYKLAWSYINTSQYDKAVLALKRTLEVSQKAKSDQRVIFEHEALNDLARVFAMAGQYEEGDKFFEAMGQSGHEYLVAHWHSAAEFARDRRDYARAQIYFKKILTNDPVAYEAKDLEMERLLLLQKEGNLRGYAQGLDQFAKNFGADSDWMSARKADERKALVEELVATLRKEAKYYHNYAQKKKAHDLFVNARDFYKAYLNHVPEPNADTPENLHEMRFFYGELLYKLEDYKAAAVAYESVGEGNFGSAAAYARVLSLQNAAKKDSTITDQLVAATEAFQAKYPKDERVGDIQYAAAYQAFQAGDNVRALAGLKKLTESFGGTERGVEAAERILFILEKDLKEGKIDSDSLEKEAQLLRANSLLVKTGGSKFSADLDDFVARLQFKKVEQMPEGNADAVVAKANAYLNLAPKLEKDLREKALNNANVYAAKTEDAALKQRTANELIRQFPESNFSKNVYLQKADLALKEGRFAEALSEFDAFAKKFPKDPNIEAVIYNKIYLRSHLENTYLPELYPAREMSKPLLGDIESYMAAYPNGKYASEVFGLAVFRKGVTSEALAKLKAPKSAEPTLDAARIVVLTRSGKDLSAVVAKNPPEKIKASPYATLLKAAMGNAQFQLLEPEYKKYQEQKLNYKGQAFVSTLKKKLSTLEKLEKSYFKVVAYGHGESALKSLDRLSGLYRKLAEDILKAPATPEELKPFTDPLLQKSEAMLSTCLDKGAEIKVRGAQLEACRKSMLETAPEKVTLRDELLPEPFFTAASAKDADLRPLMHVALSAYEAKKYGEYDLASEAMQKLPDVKPVEQATLAAMDGVIAWRLGAGEEAANDFKKASDFPGEETSKVRRSALMSLGALYVQTGNYNPALETVEPLAPSDATAALITGIAYAGLKKYDQAIQAYDLGLEKNPKYSLNLYNKAVALASANKMAEAAAAMGKYIEVENPQSSHSSRALYRRYKGAVK